MKKILANSLFVTALLLVSMQSMAQWTSNVSSVFLDANNSNKNVGINTALPGAAFKLDVNGFFRVNSISNPGRDYRIQCTSRQEIFANNDLVTFTYASNGKVINNGNPAGTGTFFVSNNTESNRLMTILPGGNVGIGTANPTKKLQVEGDATVNGRLAAATSTPNDLVDFVNNASNVGPSSSVIWVNYSNASQPNNPMLIQASTAWPGGDRFAVRNDGQVSIGDAPINVNGLNASKYRLYVAKGILTEKVKVALIGTADWADFVFEDDYQLSSLEEVEQFTKCENHLPGVPSAQQLVDEQGFDLGKMDATLLQKIEELHLHLFDMNKQIKALQSENMALKTEVHQTLRVELEALKAAAGK